MDKIIERAVGKFKAKTAEGKTVTIIIMQEFIIGTLAFGETVHQESPGDRRFVTSGGRPVNQIDENTYEAMINGEFARVTKMGL